MIRIGRIGIYPRRGATSCFRFLCNVTIAFLVQVASNDFDKNGAVSTDEIYDWDRLGFEHATCFKPLRVLFACIHTCPYPRVICRQPPGSRTDFCMLLSLMEKRSPFRNMFGCQWLYESLDLLIVGAGDKFGIFILVSFYVWAWGL